MDYYKDWMDSSYISDKDKIQAQKLSPEERQDAFYQKLSFGTAGLRGKLGPGTNRMNRYTVGLALEALARYLTKHFKAPSLVVGRDTRHGSEDFAHLAREILSRHKVQVYYYEDPLPTPTVAYGVRTLKTSAGLMVTASHNPRAYNGLKVYNDQGLQIGSTWAKEILDIMNGLDFGDIALEDKGDMVQAQKVGQDVLNNYVACHLNRALHEDINRDLKITYTPLHGVGNKPVRHILKARGFNKVSVVKSQEMPDPDFTTAPYPNPEFSEALKEAFKQADKEGSKLIIATDPDADRVSLAVKAVKKDQWVHLNGNQIGALLIDYILHGLKDQEKLPEKGALVKSIVTGDLGFAIAKDFGVHCFESLTGFKNICAPVPLWKKTGAYQFIFGYEESIGYIYGDDIYDKDGVIISMILAEMAAYYDTKGKDLLDALRAIYEKYGTHRENLFSIQFEGPQGQKEMEEIMDGLRNKPLEDLAGHKLEKLTDFIDGYKGSLDLEPQNLLRYDLEAKTHIYFRPSGTEPKLKIYMYTKASSIEEGDKTLKAMEEDLRKKIQG